MSISFNWRRKSDGEPLTKIRVTHTLTRSDLAALLIANVMPFTEEQLADMSKPAMEHAIRAQLWGDPDRRHWWQDNYGEAGELTPDQVSEWAERQVAKL